MIQHAYTLYDRKSLIYSPPFFAVADGVAVRMVQDLVGDANTQPGRHPNDFVLYRCGGYDDSSGQLLPVTALEHISDCAALVPQHRALPFDPQPSASARAAVQSDTGTEEVRFNGTGV